MTKGWLYSLVCASVLALAGCHERTTPVAAPEVSENPAMRTVVPLVRSLGPEALSKPIVLEFDVPAYPKDADLNVSSIFIGVRVADKEMGVAADRSYKLRAARIAANLRLYRLDGVTSQPQSLRRIQRLGPGQFKSILLDGTGYVPGLMPRDADTPSMQVAGLSAPGVESRELEWAYLYQMIPGQYRLHIQIHNPDEVLLQEGAELLVAFPRQAK